MLRLNFLLASTLASLCAASVLAQELPPKVSVQYWAYADPGQPAGPVIHEFKLTLAPVERSGNWVRWSVVEVEIQDKSGATTRRWSDDAAVCATFNGDWSVEHADPLAPTAADFIEPPGISGTAAAVEGVSAALHYQMEGGALGGTGPWPVTAQLDYSLRLDGTSLPFAEVADEPVQVPPVGETD